MRRFKAVTVWGELTLVTDIRNIEREGSIFAFLKRCGKETVAIVSLLLLGQA